YYSHIKDERRKKRMKKFLAKYSGVIACLALFVATSSANVACGYLAYQPKLPEGAKKLRKF
ncbi:MAG TPA: cyclic lactone autoinducer peptide, partial [Clostridia bacterium]|nr:cyclic lactone autoinducer peptide [Clostridia bacterium]